MMGAQGIVAYSALGLGAGLYVVNTVLGMRDFGKSESRYLGILRHGALSLRLDGEDFRYSCRLQAIIPAL